MRAGVEGAAAEPDGSWEAAVADVTVAGRPTVVYDLATQWHTLAGRTADSLRYLEKLRALLFDGRDAWRGPAATEYQQVLGEIGRRIEQVEQDCQRLARHLDRTGQSLSTAVSRIPVPVDIGHDFLVFGRTHELPGGTDLDDSLHDPNAFVGALVADYRANPEKYRDFRAMLLQSDEYGAAAGGRYSRRPADDQGTTGTADERRRQLVDAWYQENAGVAAHAYGALRAEYNEQAPSLDLDGGGTLAASDTGGSGGGTGSSGGGTGAVPASYGGGTRLAGSGAGLVRPGVADAGPGLSPTAPVTSARDAVAGTGPGDGVGAVGAPGVGAVAGVVARREWQGDEDDVWQVELGPPNVIE